MSGSVEIRGPKAGEQLVDAHGLTWTRLHFDGAGFAKPLAWWETYALGYRVRVWFDAAAGGWVLEQHERGGWRRLKVCDREHECMATIGEVVRSAGR